MIRTDFALADSFSDGLALVGVGTGDPGWERWGYIDPSGKVVVEPQYFQAQRFSEGLAAVSVRQDCFGYIDKTGKMVIEPHFSRATPFSGGLAAVWGGSETGYIDKTGKLVVEWESESGSFLQPFSGGCAMVVKTYYSDGDPMSTPWGYIDTSGSLVTGLEFGEARPFSDGRAAVATGDGWGYIDKTGEMIIQPRFDLAGAFSGGLAVVALDSEDKLAYIDKTGAIVFEWQYPWMNTEFMATVFGEDPTGGYWLDEW